MQISDDASILQNYPQSINNQVRYFCYLYIKRLPQAIISLPFFIVGILLLIKASHQFHQARKLSVMNRQMKRIYIVIFAWAVLFIIKIVFAQILFWIQYSSQENPPITNADDQTYSKVSKYLFVVDVAGVFLVQTVFILVPYNWMQKIVEIFQQTSNIGTGKDQEYEQTENYLKFQVLWIRLLKIYLTVRIFFFGFVIPFLVVDSYTPQTIIVQIMLILLVVEAAFVSGIVFFGWLAVKRNTRLVEIVDQQQINVILNQYIILIACAVARLAMDSIFVGINFRHIEQYDVCKIGEKEMFWQVVRIANLIAEGLFTNYLPIFIILRIFKVEITSVELSESLIGEENLSENAVK